MKNIITIFLLSFIFLLSCKRECVKNSVSPVFIGFSPADIDTFVLRAYKSNDNYQHLVDTVLVRLGGRGIYTTSGDTTTVFVNDSDPNHSISPGFDWEVYIPAKNRTISISDIKETQIKNYGRVCWNPINSFIQDGRIVVPQLVETGQDFTSGYMTYIHNQ
jgi:hypothetical protein